MPWTVALATGVRATANQISESPSCRLENIASCHLKSPPVSEVKRWPPEVGPSVASRATTRVLGCVVENDFDEIDSDGKLCSVSETVLVARLLGPAMWMLSIAVARLPAMVAYARPRRRGKRGAFADARILGPAPA